MNLFIIQNKGLFLTRYRLLKLLGMTIMILATSNVCFGIFSKKWSEITAEELAQEHSIVDPSADAEYLERYTQFDDSSWRATYVHVHNKIKVFTEKGVEDLSVIKITLPNKDSLLRGFKARIIRPDGSIEIIKRRDLYKKDAVKYVGNAIYQQSFSLPGLTVGCIIEYQFTKELKYAWSSYNHIELLENYPTLKLDLLIKAFPGRSSQTRAFNCHLQVEKKRGGVLVQTTLLPASKQEPLGPPLMEIEPWILLYYYNERKIPEPDKYW